MQKGGHRFSKKKVAYKGTNWRDYNSALKQRDSLTVWLSDDLEGNWLAPSIGDQKRGRPFVYSQACISLT